MQIIKDTATNELNCDKTVYISNLSNVEKLSIKVCLPDFVSSKNFRYVSKSHSNIVFKGMMI